MPNYESLRDHVYNYICKKIQDGELRPNEKLNESRICEDLSISRTPAREALIKLASDNLLNYTPRKGFSVKEITSKQKEDTYVIIASLDALAAKLAFSNITEADFNKMNEIVDKIDISIKYKNFKEYSSLQADFHNVYASKCNNQTLIDLLDSLKISFIPIIYFSKDDKVLYPVLKDINNEHRQIIELFKQKDSSSLEKYLINVHWSLQHPEMI